ncbi:alpha/beta-hydrolase [Melanomma pulvis-pyrius CBS 109.77]|uniref:Alpha/beta-hydrolase n=1 Tax=Melanomma pulvis-pyrius CBS 109.77 TaxID=1314802 RepID=A0A6A6XB40_9PLEO|nr:alpha/beta-hydrolase [Melanomma pulvis-pyrius CBS 109.77]
MATKPQIVLIPGAWHTPAAFSTIIAKLEEAGYTVHTRQLPSVGNPKPPTDLSEDIVAVQDLVTEAIGDGNDVVVVPHSWAGIVAGSGLVGYGKKQREENGEKGGIVKGAYMCAFIVPEGVSLMDAIQHQIPEWWTIEVCGPHSVANDPNIFYNDLSPSEQQKYFALIKSHAIATKYSKSTAASWKDIPTTYLLCEDDNAIPAFAQDLMTGGVKAMGGEIEVERIKSSHSPYLSQPDVVVGWIRRAAGEEI